MIRVAVLEDDADLRELLSTVFLDAGASSCVLAESVAELKRCAPEVLSCDIVFLDINLGRNQPSGIDAYNWLRGQEFTGKIVFLTGHARSHPLVSEAASLDGVLLLEKPLPVDALLHLLEEPRR